MSLNIIERLEALEAAVANLPTSDELNLKINSANDQIGILMGEVEEIKEQISVIVFPENYEYILTQQELDFIKDGIAKVSKILVELEEIKNSLIRAQLTYP